MISTGTLAGSDDHRGCRMLTMDVDRKKWIPLPKLHLQIQKLTHNPCLMAPESPILELNSKYMYHFPHTKTDTQEIYVDPPSIPSIPPSNSIQLRPFTPQVVLERAWYMSHMFMHVYLPSYICTTTFNLNMYAHKYIYIHSHIVFSAWKHTGLKLTEETLC